MEEEEEESKINFERTEEDEPKFEYKPGSIEVFTPIEDKQGDTK